MTAVRDQKAIELILLSRAFLAIIVAGAFLPRTDGGHSGQHRLLFWFGLLATSLRHPFPLYSRDPSDISSSCPVSVLDFPQTSVRQQLQDARFRRRQRVRGRRRSPIPFYSCKTQSDRLEDFIVDIDSIQAHGKSDAKLVTLLR